MGASRWQVGHHGAQNHSTAGLPAKLSPEKGSPSIVVALNCNCAGTGGCSSTGAGLEAATDVVVAAGGVVVAVESDSLLEPQAVANAAVAASTAIMVRVKTVSSQDR